MQKPSLPILIAGVLCLAGCQSGGPPPEAGSQAPKSKPTQTYSGREAFQRLYVSARGWAGDARPYRLESRPTSDANGQDGRAAVWRASFASAARGAIKTLVWSGSQAEGAPEPGITPGIEDTYNPANRATQVFELGFLKVDSGKALEVSKERGGARILRRNPEQPVSYILDWDVDRSVLTWHVIYGPSPSQAVLRVAVNAASGGYLRVEK
jgi:hypothetical protein